MAYRIQKTSLELLPIPHMKDSSSLHLEQFNLAWNTLHTQVLQRPVPVVIIKVAELLKIVSMALVMYTAYVKSKNSKHGISTCTLHM